MDEQLIDFQSVLSELQISEAELSNLVARGDLRVIPSGGKPMFDPSDVNNLRKNRETEPTISIPSGGDTPSDSAEQLDTEDMVLTEGDDTPTDDSPTSETIVGEDTRTSETIVDDFDPMSEMIEDERTEATLSLPNGPESDVPETPTESLEAGRGGLVFRRLAWLVFLGSVGLNGIFAYQWYMTKQKTGDDAQVSDSQGQIEKLQQQVTDLTDRNAELQQKLDQVEASAQKLKTVQRDTVGQLAALAEVNKGLQKQLEGSEVPTIEADADEQDVPTKIEDQEILGLRLRLRETEDEFTDMKNQLALAEARHRNLTGEFETLRAKQGEELQEFTERRLQLEKELEALKHDLMGKERKLKTGAQYWEVERQIRMNPDDPQVRIDALSELVEGATGTWLGPVVHYRLACAYSLRARSWPRKQKDRRAEDANTALDHLEKALNSGFDHIDHMKRDPDLKTIRREARYKELLASIERLNAERDQAAPDRADQDQATQ